MKRRTKRAHPPTAARKAKPAPPPTGGSTFLPLSEVKRECVDWLWKDYIPIGKLTILEGDPDEGKSVLSLDIAARTSTGAPMPLQTERRRPGGVIILSAEDGAADTIRPRLEAAGADVSRIRVLRSDQLVRIPQDLDDVEAAVKEAAARLIIVDPLTAFLDRSFDLHRDQDVRHALTPLANLAARTSVAVLIIRHLKKGDERHAKYRGMGSIGIGGAARSGLLLAHDPNDSGRRILAPFKANLTGNAASLSLSLEAHGESVRVRWHGLSVPAYTANQLLAQLARVDAVSQLDRARAFLSEQLKDGAHSVEELVVKAEREGIAKITLRRAREAMNIRTQRRGFGSGGEWLCSLDGGRDEAD